MWLEQASRLDPREVGPKALRLGRLRAAGLPVPNGFVVTASAWRAVAAQNGLEDPGAESPTRDELRELAARAQRGWLESRLPPELSEAVASALAQLRPTGALVAVRSTAADEDGQDASAAGLFHTALDVGGLEEVLAALKRCWASLCSEAALAYRLDRELPLTGRTMAVLIQVMVQPDAAGVLFSQPVHNGPSGQEDEGAFLVEAVPGQGAALVDGRRDPVRYTLPRKEPARTSIGPPGEGTADERRRGDAGDELLSPAALRELRLLAMRVEAELGDEVASGVDIEWAWGQRAMHLLQARPITRAAPTANTARVRWTAANTQEALLEPVTPLTWSLLAPLVEAGRRDLFRAAGLEEIPGPGYMRLFYGLPYFNPDYFRGFLRQIPGAPQNIFDALIFGEGDAELDVRLPEFTPRTVRLLGIFVLLRLGARERFELYQRVFNLRLGWLKRRPLAGLDDAELLGLRRRATTLLEEALRRHVLGTAISGGGYLLLELFLRRTGVARALPSGLTSRLTSGASGNALAEASARLEDMARRIASELSASPELLGEVSRGARVAAASPPGPGHGESAAPAARRARGEALAAGVLEDFQRFLRDYGHRCEQEAELLEPRWADDPGVLLDVLDSYVSAARDEGGLTRLRQRESSLARGARVLASRVSRELVRAGGLERLLPVKRVTFRLLLREARRYAPYRENLKDRALRALHLLRRVFLEAGARLARRGVLERAEDVFFLEVEEVEAALSRGAQPATAGAAPGDASSELRARVSERRAERERYAGRRAPKHVIEVPGYPPRPVEADGPHGRMLLGAGVSGGRVSGVARVLRSMDDARRLAPGEIIVARVINAAWTPLFHLAGAIVAEVGGLLSHGAIVAREYGIPAVFGAEGASAIPDGARICVDGDLGLVTLEEEP